MSIINVLVDKEKSRLIKSYEKSSTLKLSLLIYKAIIFGINHVNSRSNQIIILKSFFDLNVNISD